MNGRLGFADLPESYDHDKVGRSRDDGVLRIENGRETLRFQVSGGFLQVVDDVITILSERATAA